MQVSRQDVLETIPILSLTSCEAVWLQNWSSENEKNPNGHLAMYLGIYTLLNAVTLIGLVGSAWLVDSFPKPIRKLLVLIKY